MMDIPGRCVKSQRPRDRTTMVEMLVKHTLALASEKDDFFCDQEDLP